jgi:hypothetical protein
MIQFTTLPHPRRKAMTEPVPVSQQPAVRGLGGLLSNVLDGRKKLLVAGGLGSLIATIPAANPWVEIAKIAGIALISAVHNHAQSKADQVRLLTQKPGFDYAAIQAALGKKAMP